MCYILLSTCQTCTWPLAVRYTPCSHALSHAFTPEQCPNRMKRRRLESGERLCGKCDERRGSLSCGPFAVLQEEDGEYVGKKGRERERERRGSCSERDSGYEGGESDEDESECYDYGDVRDVVDGDSERKGDGE